jgi:hypothetical protein
MAKKTSEKLEGINKNGALVFEKMGKDFTIPPRKRSGAYDDALKLLQETDEVVAVFHAGPVARGANTRRKSLLDAAEAAGLKIRASVRAIKLADGSVDNVLLAQMGE